MTRFTTSGVREHKVGPLLREALALLEGGDSASALLAAGALEAISGQLPVVLDCAPPGFSRRDERWESYCARVDKWFKPIQDRLQDLTGCEVEALRAAGSLRVRVTRPQVERLQSWGSIQWIELDPFMQVVRMNDASQDIGLPEFRNRLPAGDGSGVRVAVLDSGVDLHHPCLKVTDSTSTCRESMDIPGEHATHCAGIIASTDSSFPGVAPAVELVNIKVVDANGCGFVTEIARGIDKALERNAHVISISLGFNHLPKLPKQGQGQAWACPGGNCTLCKAVNNAVTLGDAVVVVAAGNEHENAEALRLKGHGNRFDTELTCPGQAQNALTVGAHTTGTLQRAPFSSLGPTAYGQPKPDIYAPGINITSTVPLRRDASGAVCSPVNHSEMFRCLSGTSAATPMVAGAVALLIQQKLEQGLDWTPATIRSELLTKHSVADQKLSARRLRLS